MLYYSFDNKYNLRYKVFSHIINRFKTQEYTGKEQAFVEWGISQKKLSFLFWTFSFPAAQIPVTHSRLQTCKENWALCRTFGNIAMKTLCTKVSIFLKPQDQRVEEEIGSYECTVEDEGLIYSHSCRNCSPQSGESTCPSFQVLGCILKAYLTFVDIW